MSITMKAWLDEVRGQAWALDPERLEGLARRVAFADAAGLKEELALGFAPERDQPARRYQMRGTAAVVPIQGLLMRRVPSWMRWMGANATATGDVRAAVEEAVLDPRVERIVLSIDSPGGEAKGIHEVGEALLEARNKKPLDAVVDGLACSGGYWLASQANTITASIDSYIGGIGVYQVWTDWSKAAEREGVLVHVVRSGEHKGMGEHGAPITPAQLKVLQGLVDGMAALFVGAVARGRGATKKTVRSLATGQVWLANAAKAEGLIDQVEPASRALGRLAPQEDSMALKKAKTSSNAKATNESGETIAAEAEATQGHESARERLAELRAAFPDDLEFAVAQFEEGSTLEQAKAAYADVLKTQLDEEKAGRAAEREEAAKAAKTKAAGPPAPRPPVPAAPALKGSGDPGAAAEESRDFMAVSRAYAKEHGTSMTSAMSAVARRDPDLHADWKDNQPKVRRAPGRFDRIDRPSR